MADEKKKEKIRAIIAAAKKRKQTYGKVNIENVSAPKKRKPKKQKKEKKKQVAPAQVSIGARGGRYIQEASGHKRYVKDGSLAGAKRFKKSVQAELGKIIKSMAIEEFVKSFKKEKNK